ncbi:hypothetical protein [Phaeodactylibacter xiamenensis]|uniref:hypothetical protein n=1 Tax=Phaeodactylibacter xiamenensis TaxID=1524460 RepID=UPI0024A8D3AD|nr:hypothetical protein [Phaeodactylibacter xiamenensis]
MNKSTKTGQRCTPENTKPGDIVRCIKNVDVKIKHYNGKVETIKTQYRKDTYWKVSCLAKNHGKNVIYTTRQGCCAINVFEHA